MRVKQSLLLWVALTFSASLSFASPYSGRVTPLEVFFENASGSPLIPLITAAQHLIDIEIYEMDDSLVRSAIKNAVDRGVRVRIIKDPTPVGGSCQVFRPLGQSDSAGCRAEKELVAYVREKGGTFEPFNKDALCALPGGKCFQHGKMLLADQQKVLLSTGNFNLSSLCNTAESPKSCNRDYTVVSSDPKVIDLLQTVFDKDLAGAPYDIGKVMAHAANPKVTISPYSLSPIVQFLHSAKRVIQIQNQYLKDPAFNQAILDAAARGVEIQVMVASACSFGIPSVGDEKKWKAVYGAFDRAGIKTRIFTRAIQIKNVLGYLHAKAIVVDDARAWVGSVNGSTMSLMNNREYGIFLDDVTEVQKLSAFMYTDFADQNSESWEESLACKNDPRLPVPGDDGNSLR